MNFKEFNLLVENEQNDEAKRFFGFSEEEPINVAVLQQKFEEMLKTAKNEQEKNIILKMYGNIKEVPHTVAGQPVFPGSKEEKEKRFDTWLGDEHKDWLARHRERMGTLPDEST